MMKGIALSPFLMAAENFLIDAETDSTAAFTSQNAQVKASAKSQ